MKSYSWKRLLSIGLSVSTLFIGSAVLTGCETGEVEGEGIEEEAPLEEEGIGEEPLEEEPLEEE